jgi:hypothetical protein
MARRDPADDETVELVPKSPRSVVAYRNEAVPQDPMDAQRTEFAQEAFKLSSVFTFVFDKKVYGSLSPRRLQVHEPDGQSTGGGLKARQSIVLGPQEGNTRARAIVCGWLDSSKRSAELRAFDSVRRQYETRHQRSFDFAAEDYARMVEDVREFTRTNAIELSLPPPELPVPTRPSAAPPPPVKKRPPGAPTWMIVTIVILGIVVVILSALIVARLKS